MERDNTDESTQKNKDINIRGYDHRMKAYWYPILGQDSLFLVQGAFIHVLHSNCISSSTKPGSYFLGMQMRTNSKPCFRSASFAGVENRSTDVNYLLWIFDVKICITSTNKALGFCNRFHRIIIIISKSYIVHVSTKQGVFTNFQKEW